MADWADEKARELHRVYFSGRDTCSGGCGFTKLVAAALRDAAKQEREVCAKIAEEAACECDSSESIAVSGIIAGRIRARDE